MSLRDRVHCLCTPEMPRKPLKLHSWCHNDLHGGKWHLNLVLKGPSNVNCKLSWGKELLSPGPGVDSAVVVFIWCRCEVFGKLLDSRRSYPTSGLVLNVLQSVICLWCTCTGNGILCLHFTHGPLVTKTPSRIRGEWLWSYGWCYIGKINQYMLQIACSFVVDLIVKLKLLLQQELFAAPCIFKKMWASAEAVSKLVIW